MVTHNQKKKILIVDDSEDIRTLLQQVLEEESDYILQFAEDGQQALQKAKEFRPDLVLLDISLPEMSGWDVIPQLQLLPDLAQMAIVAVTAHVSKADQERAIALGCIAHLGKPFDIETLLETISQVMSDPTYNT